MIAIATSAGVIGASTVVSTVARNNAGEHTPCGVLVSAWIVVLFFVLLFVFYWWLDSDI